MTLQVFTLNESDKWDEIVKSFSKHDVYYLSGYTKAFYIHGDGEPLLFYYDNKNVRAINVVMKRDVSKDKKFSGLINENEYFDLTTPYGYGGWLIEGDGELTELFTEYKNWCKDNSIISEVIRFHPVLNNVEAVRDVYDVMDLGKTIAIDLRDKDYIWNNYSAKNRNVIRKAIKNNVEIKTGRSKELFKEFVSIYEKTMNHDDADDYYYFSEEFYDSILTDLKDHAVIYYAQYEEKVIAASIMLMCNGYLSYHLSGQLFEYRTLCATNHLLDTTAKWGSDNGYKYLHLGGGVGSREDNLYSFKKAFNYKNEGFQYSIGRMIFDDEKYNALVEMRKGSELRENFFPLYRA